MGVQGFVLKYRHILHIYRHNLNLTSTHKTGLKLNFTTHIKNDKRIRVTKHSLQIHLLFAVWAHLLLPNDAPASYAELVEPWFGVKAQHRKTEQQLTRKKGQI